MRRSTQRC
ncbi:hypothetical protein MTR67_026399 [Solanum verrucosum]|uniref:Uncharacterized protein n=1 Tax=Solanum verrucosum TaxID=315347 RepID=A0AAF0QYV3_SOLVR|nr:hypothetical protein MTR67_026399 [Solanum verrucosum]